MMPPPSITLEKAHDVRHLRGCALCPEIGDDRHMVQARLNAERVKRWIHGRCALSFLGINGLLKLPKNERDKLTLGEIGPAAMKRLVEQETGNHEAKK